MQKEHILNLLTNFSFTEEEADIYLAALTTDKATASQIARDIGKSRTATYFHIRKLVEKGVLKEAKGSKITKYIAKPPEELADSFQTLTEDFRSVLPELLNLNRIEKGKPLIEVLESKKGYYSIYEEISVLPHNSYFMVLEGFTAVKNELKLLNNDQWEKFFQRIVDRKIMTKGLFTDESLNEPSNYLSSKAQKLLASRIWNMRTMPEETLPIKQLIFIYGRKVAILFPENALVIKIEHEGITELFKTLFNTLYSLGKPVTAPWNQKSS